MLLRIRYKRHLTSAEAAYLTLSLTLIVRSAKSLRKTLTTVQPKVRLLMRTRVVASVQRKAGLQKVRVFLVRLLRK